jgi:predicted  nucleic acid-binding Zn-ribbon protein
MRILEVQEIDLEIDKLIKAEKDYPDQIEFLKTQVENLSRALADLEANLEDSRRTRRDIEDEVKAEREMLEKKEKRLLETKTNKEYSAVQSEIEQARERIDALESEEIETIGKIEKLEPQIEENRKRLAETTDENAARVQELEARLGSIESDIHALEEKRDALKVGMNKRILDIYHRLRKGRSPIAVAPLHKAKLSCSGCFKHLPPQRIQEIRRGKTLVMCETCGRIIVWDDRDGEE